MDLNNKLENELAMQESQFKSVGVELWVGGSVCMLYIADKLVWAMVMD